jgi:hypothetical protein
MRREGSSFGKSRSASFSYPYLTLQNPNQEMTRCNSTRKFYPTTISLETYILNEKRDVLNIRKTLGYITDAAPRGHSSGLLPISETNSSFKSFDKPHLFRYLPPHVTTNTFLSTLFPQSLLPNALVVSSSIRAVNQAKTSIPRSPLPLSPSRGITIWVSLYVCPHFIPFLL